MSWRKPEAETHPIKSKGQNSAKGFCWMKSFIVKDTICYLAVSKVKTSSSKVTVKAGYAKAGDVIKIKASGKTYTKNVKANASCFKYTQKIKKQKKGAKIKVTVYNKFKQVRRTKTIKVIGR